MNNFIQSEGGVCPNTYHGIDSRSQAQESDGEEHPALGGGCEDMEGFSGDGAPRLVIRGESFEDTPCFGETSELIALGYKGRAKLVHRLLPKPDAEPLAALTDFLNATFPYDPTPENITRLVKFFRMFLGEAFAALNERKRGLHGYKVSFAIGNTGGMLAYGGQRGTVLVSLPGAACALITDWQSCYHLFHDILKARISRWDGAVDVFDGKPSVDDAVLFYQTGQFNAGGNKPSCKQHGNWLEDDGSGRTFYVGKRENGKLLRVYEKGKQLGDSSSSWVRWELELHNRDRVIPWDVILEPGKYLAASYPCMTWASDVQERIRTTRQTATLGYQHLIYYARQAYGPLINVMLEVEGSAEKVIECLLRPGVPARLDLGELLPAAFIIPTNGASDVE